MLLKRGEGAFSVFWAFWLAFEPCSIDVSKRANRPRSSCPSRSLPSFTAMLLKCGEGCFFPSWRLLLAFFFGRSEAHLMPSDRAAARSSSGADGTTTSCPSKARSVPQCHTVSVWQNVRFWAFWLAFEPRSRSVSKRANGSRPSGFTAMLLKRGEGCFFPSWRLLLAFSFDR